MESDVLPKILPSRTFFFPFFLFLFSFSSLFDVFFFCENELQELLLETNKHQQMAQVTVIPFPQALLSLGSTNKPNCPFSCCRCMGSPSAGSCPSREKETKAGSAGGSSLRTMPCSITSKKGSVQSVIIEKPTLSGRTIFL